jgi:hypothetical protein
MLELLPNVALPSPAIPMLYALPNILLFVSTDFPLVFSLFIDVSILGEFNDDYFIYDFFRK